MAFTADKVRQGVQQAAAGGYSVDNSLRFNANDSPYLSRTFGTATNRKKWTISMWVKLGTTSSTTARLFGGKGSGDYCSMAIENTGTLTYWVYGGNGQLTTTQLFRDPSAWYHIIWSVDTTQSTASNRIKLYVNGEQVTDFATSNYPSQDFNTYINNSSDHDIGRDSWYGNHFWGGYMSEINFIDGQALDHTSFGETGDYGEWKPIEVTGMTYGTNGFYLDFSNSGSLGTDASSNTNNWTVNNLAATDQMLDSPTNNFCTWNPLAPNHADGIDLKEGNLSNNLNRTSHSATFGFDSGKWYWEFLAVTANFMLGLVDRVDIRADSGHHYLFISHDNQQAANGTTLDTDSFSSASAGDIIGFAYDVDAQTMDIYQNNSLVLEFSTVPKTKTNYFFCDRSANATGYQVVNFGQDSSFAGNKTAQGNQDGNEIGDFYYSVPTGFLALCTNNLTGISTPYQAYSSCSTEDEYKEVTYTGNGSSDGTFIYLGFLATNICIDGTNYTNASTSSFDFLSNGIKCRSTTKNSNGTSYTLEAWVDTDFKYNTAEGN